MKKIFAVLCLTLCFVPTFGVSSCKPDVSESSYTSSIEEDSSLIDNVEESSVEESSVEESSVEDSSVEDSNLIDTVEELKIAIKKNPYEYADTQVSINGTIYIHIDNGIKTIRLVDYFGDMRGIGGSTSFEVGLYASPKIEIKMSNDSYCLFETGDYVNMIGTVKISNGMIYLDDCKYTTILTHEERR